jgi:hypothetical protein
VLSEFKKGNKNWSAGGTRVIHCQSRQQKTIFPAAFVDPIGKIAEVDHDCQAKIGTIP